MHNASRASVSVWVLVVVVAESMMFINNDSKKKTKKETQKEKGSENLHVIVRVAASRVPSTTTQQFVLVLVAANISINDIVSEKKET